MNGLPTITCRPANSTALPQKRRTIDGIALRHGAEIRIEGTPDRGDPAALDYVEIQREGFKPQMDADKSK